VDVAGDILTVTTQHITSIDYDLQGAADFQSYAHDKLLAGLDQYIAALITAPPYSIAATRPNRSRPGWPRGLVAHYAATRSCLPTCRSTYRAFPQPTDYPTKLAGHASGKCVDRLAPPDNSVSLDLATR